MGPQKKAARAFPVLLLGCLTLSNLSISSADTKSTKKSSATFTLVAADGMPLGTNQSFSYVFRQVDIASGKFGAKTFTVEFTSVGTGDELDKPESLRTSMRFGGKATPAGDFALISRSDRRRFGGGGHHTTAICYGKGTYVYNLRAGHINIIPIPLTTMDSPADHRSTHADALVVLAGRPKMTAPVNYVDPSTFITFEFGTNAVGRETCTATKTFSHPQARN